MATSRNAAQPCTSAQPRKAAPARKTARDQQGARGRAVAPAAQPPIQVPHTSRVPGHDSDYLTTALGVRLPHTDDSLKACEGGSDVDGGLPPSWVTWFGRDP